MHFSRVKWSPVEEEYLRAHRNDTSVNQLCVRLAKSRNAIKKKLNELDGIQTTTSKTKGAGRISYVGRREDCDNIFLRSRWEANFYRYLKQRRDVEKIEYEPHDFSFTDFGILKGTVSYTPDFRVTFKDGSYIWVEVKGGFMPNQDKTKIRRFKKYYPEEASKLVALTPGRKSKTAQFFKGEGIPIRWEYPKLQKRWRKRIPGWEE